MDSDCKVALKEMQKQLWATWDVFFFAPSALQPHALACYKELQQQNKDLMKRCKR